MSSVGRNIRSFRVDRGLSQAELGERVGKRRSAIGNYESGAREPDYDTLKALAKALGVSVMALLRDEAQPDEGEDALWELREALRRDPDRRMLFSLAKNGSEKDVRQVAALIDALKKTNPDFYDGD